MWAIFPNMTRLRHHRLILGLLAFLAVGWAQTLGLHRGFVCDCGGVEHFTQVDHCHGPHSAACHEDDDHLPAQSHDDETDGDTHTHAAVVDSLIAKQQQDVTLDVPTRSVVVETLNLENSDRLPTVAVRGVMETPPRRGDLLHEWPRRLAQVIALRV